MSRDTTLAVRFTTKDAETVRAALKTMGVEGERALKAIDRAAKAAKPSTKALVAVADDLRTGMEGVAGDIPGVSAGLRAIGPAGVVAAGALGLAAAGAMALARGAIEAGRRAAELVDETQRIGIGVEAFQELTFAADESGVAIEKVAPALDGLNSSIGAIKAGLGDVRKIKAFEALGISREQVEQFASLEQALPVIADALANVQDQAERVRIAEALGIRDLLPVLEQGSAGLRGMAERARELGLVVEESLIRKADEANREIEIATLRMTMAFERLKLAVVPALGSISTSVADLVVEIADALSMVTRFADAAEIISRRLTNGSLAQRARTAWGLAANPVGTMQDAVEMAERREQLRGVRGGSRSGHRSPPPPPSFSAGMASFQSTVAEARQATARARARSGSGGDGGAAARAAAEERDRLEDRRRDQRNAQEMNRVAVQRLEQAVASYEFEAADSEVRITAAERARELAVRERAVAEERNRQAVAQIAADKDLTAATRDALLAAQATTHSLELREIAAREAAALEEWQLEQEKRTADARAVDADLIRQAQDTDVEASRSMARTRQESLAVELAILDVAYNRQRAEVEASEASDKAKAIALAALARARRVMGDQVDRDHQTGLQRYRDELDLQARSIDDQLNDIAADGLRATEDALSDLITGTRDWGDAFSNVARGIIADLARIAARQWILLPLMNGLGLGGAGNAGGGFNLGGLFGRATGGAVAARTPYVIGERGPELFMPGIGGSVIPNDALRRMGAPAAAGGLQVHIHNAPPGTTAVQRPDGGLDVMVGRLEDLEGRVARREQSFSSDVAGIVIDGIRRKVW